LGVTKAFSEADEGDDPVWVILCLVNVKIVMVIDFKRAPPSSAMQLIGKNHHHKGGGQYSYNPLRHRTYKISKNEKPIGQHSNCVHAKNKFKISIYLPQMS
jgi:hypothetical protein